MKLAVYPSGPEFVVVVETHDGSSRTTFILTPEQLREAWEEIGAALQSTEVITVV